MLATEAVGGGSRQRRVGEGHLGVVLDSVNTLFESFLNFFENPQNSEGLHREARVSKMGSGCGDFKPQPDFRPDTN